MIPDTCEAALSVLFVKWVITFCRHVVWTSTASTTKSWIESNVKQRDCPQLYSQNSVQYSILRSALAVAIARQYLHVPRQLSSPLLVCVAAAAVLIAICMSRARQRRAYIATVAASGLSLPPAPALYAELYERRRKTVEWASERSTRLYTVGLVAGGCWK